MAVLNAQSPTLLDLSKALGPDMRSVAAVVELLDEFNPVLQDASMVEGNLPYGMQYNVRRFLPKGTWRRLYQGVTPNKTARDQVVVNAARIEAYSEIDAAMPGDIAGLREDETRAKMEGVSQQISDAIFYGDNTVNPEQFHGLSPQYNSKSAPNGQNIIDAGGTANDNRSIWLVGWDPMKVTMFYPKARTGYDVPTGALGIRHENKGRVTTEVIEGTATGGLAEVYRDHYVAEMGLCVKDWRYAVRICNIDVSDLKADRSTGAHIENLVVRALHRFGGNTRSKGRISAYADRNLLSLLHQQLLHDKRTYIPFNQAGGTSSPDDTLAFSVGGLVIRPCDSLNRDEARVT